MPYGITQCYLPPDRGDIPAFTPAKAGNRFSDPRGMQGWVNPGGWLEMVYPLNGHPSWTNRARCWLTSLMRPKTLTTTPSRHPKVKGCRVKWRNGLRRVWNLPYSTHSDILHMPANDLPIFGERGFFYFGSVAWNTLPSNLHDITDTSTFRKRLKNVLFVRAYNWLLLALLDLSYSSALQILCWMIDWFDIIFKWIVRFIVCCLRHGNALVNFMAWQSVLFECGWSLRGRNVVLLWWIIQCESKKSSAGNNF